MKEEITITNHGRDGFRRGGRRHPRGRASYPADQFAEEDLAIIEADPNFTVERGEMGREKGLQGQSATTVIIDDPAIGEPPAVPQPRDLTDWIIQAFEKLEEGDFNADGTPSVKAVERILGDKSITKADVTAAWDAVQQAKAE